MHITNKLQLPHEVYMALAYHNYDAGESDYSVTTLLNPPRIVQLTKRHKDEMSEDAIDRLWSMFGEIAHSIFERHTHDDAKAEERLYVTILDRIIGGKFDNYRDDIISDFKITSAYTLVYGSRLKEWEEQLNLYAYLLRLHDLPVTNIRINCILRDFDKNKAIQGGKYPNAPIQIIPITLWTFEEQEAFIYEKVIEHKEAEDKLDANLPLCSSEDMWSQPNKFAVMKEGRKTAVRVFDNNKEAKDYCITSGLAEYDELGFRFLDKDVYIQERKGKRTRCESYCPCKNWCSQWKEYSSNANNS